MSQNNSKYLTFIILSQCFGQLAILSFDNGLMFNFFSELTKEDSQIILLLKVPNFICFLLVLPLAYYADRYGKKLLGQVGNVVQVFGLLIIAAASIFENPLPTLYCGVTIFACGIALFRCSWFALIDPLIATKERGHFFARLRTAWKVVGVLFTLLVQYMIGVSSSAILVQLIIFVAFLSIIQIYYYHLIPELEKAEKTSQPKRLFSELKALFKDRVLMRFCVFKLSFPLMTGSIAL
jgi:MFS family permease